MRNLSSITSITSITSMTVNRFGKNSPLLVKCSTAESSQQTQIYPKLSDFPFYKPGDEELLNAFFDTLSPFSDAQKNKRLEELDAYFDIPTIEAILKPSYEALKRCIDNNCIIPNDYPDNLLHIENIGDYAARNGHLDVLKWLKENDYSIDKWTYSWAARNGQLEILKWLRENGYQGDSSTCSYAARNGHLEVLKWLRANGCPWDANTCSSAARGGHLEVLKWARANGCDWDTSTCSYAARNGHLEVLQWARANGCPWDSLTCVYADENNHTDVVKWARANGCLWFYRYR